MPTQDVCRAISGAKGRTSARSVAVVAANGTRARRQICNSDQVRFSPSGNYTSVNGTRSNGPLRRRAGRAIPDGCPRRRAATSAAARGRPQLGRGGGPPCSSRSLRRSPCVMPDHLLDRTLAHRAELVLRVRDHDAVPGRPVQALRRIARALERANLVLQ